MLTECESHGIGFIQYRPLRAWRDPTHQAVLTTPATQHGASTRPDRPRLLLAVSPVKLPIPGTATLAHMEDNLAAAALQLEQDEVHASSAAALRATQPGTQSTAVLADPAPIGELGHSRNRESPVLSRAVGRGPSRPCPGAAGLRRRVCARRALTRFDSAADQAEPITTSKQHFASTWA
jgi:hypothetical protein